MLARVSTIAMNTYREAVRARILLGLFAIALATSGYSVVVGSMSLHQEARVVADVSSASISLYAVIVAVLIAATSLHREIELKTIFPMLSRPLRRHEYVVGKYLGALVVLTTFVAIDGGATLFILALQTGQELWKVGAAVGGLFAALALLLIRAKYTRVFVVIPWSIAFLIVAYALSSTAHGERTLVTASLALTIAEVAIVTAISTLFASFSSPFLTAIFTLLLFVIGRSADTLATLPARVFGETIASTGRVLAKVVPNLNLYVPPRPLLLGQAPDHPVWLYVGTAWLYALGYACVLLVASALAFRKRDFQ